MSENVFRFTPEERSLLARLLIDCGAFQRGNFTLASGKKSDVYIDVKLGLTRPDILALIASGMAPHIDTDKIAGVELAGVLIPGETVTIVEDVTTTGGSVISGIEAIEAGGGRVLTVVAVVDRGEGA